MTINYYDFLGVHKEAAPYDIKKAYRKLAMKYHPDRGGDIGQFQLLQEAYAVLSDNDKRFAYDNPNIDTDDIFDDVINDWYTNRPSINKNKDIEIEVELTLEDVLNGKDVMAAVELFSGKEQLVDLHIPRNVENGEVICFPHLGDDSIPTIERGDLLVTIVYLSDDMFERDEFDIIFEQSISAFDAMIGGVLTITNFDGEDVDIDIPAGIQYNGLVRKSGHGLYFKPRGKKRGDLIMRVYITIPEIKKGSDVVMIETLREKYEKA